MNNTPIYSSYRDSFLKDYRDAVTNVVAAPVVAMWAESNFKEKVNAQKPQNVFLRVDEKLNVTDGKGMEIGTLYECLTLTDCFVPVFCIDSPKTVPALEKFVFDNLIANAAVCVSYARRKLLNAVYGAMPYLHCFVDCRSLKRIPNLMRFAGDIHESHSMSVILPSALCDRKSVRTLQSRLITVMAESAGDDLPALVLSGVNGIICGEPDELYALYRRFPENSFVRHHFMYAHKGYQQDAKYPENSVSAVVNAGKHSLDGVEVDIKRTRDHRSVLMHNPTTRGILTGEERVFEELSYAELRERRRSDYPDESVDLVAEMLEAEKKYPEMQTIIELKPAANLYHVEELTQLVRDEIAASGTEYQSMLLLGDMTPSIAYIHRMCPRIPLVYAFCETKVTPPVTREEAESMAFRYYWNSKGSVAALCPEDVNVGRLYHEYAKMNLIPVFPWTRSWYFKPSTWEGDGMQGDRNYQAGYHGWTSDHAGKYLGLVESLKLDAGNRPHGVTQNGRNADAGDAFLLDLGNGWKAWGTETGLHFGDAIYVYSEAFKS